jgi:hypothetical protein
MTLPSLAQVSELEKRLGLDFGSLSGLDLERAEAALSDASALVRAEAGRDFFDIATGLVVAPDVIVTIATRSAIRAYRNPEGVVSESLGGAYQFSYAPGETSVYLTDDERRIIKSMGGGFRSASPRTPSAYGEPGSSDLGAFEGWL